MAKIAIFLVVTALYIFSSPPTVTSGDSGELITGACTLGISHPPSFPLYSLTGKLFSQLPLSNPAWRLNFASIFFAALTALLIYIILKNEFNSGAGAALFASTAYAFSGTVWSQAITAEVYSLNALLTLSCLAAAYLWHKYGRLSFFHGFFFVFGLSLANHYPLALMALPASAYLILSSGRGVNYKNILFALLFTALALALYAYLPVRSAKNPLLDWGNPETLNNFLGHVFRNQYRTLELGNRPLFSDKLNFILNFFKEALIQFHVLIPAALFGIYSAYKKRRAVFNALSLLLISNGILLTLLLSFQFNPERAGIVNVYYIPSYLSLALFAGIGLKYVFERVYSKVVRISLFLVLALPALFFFNAAFSRCVMRDNFLAWDYAGNILSFLPKDSVLFIDQAGDESLFPALYAKAVLGKRGDLAVYDCFGNVFTNIYGEGFSLITDKNLWLKTRSAVENEIIKSSGKPVFYLTFAPDQTVSTTPLKQAGLCYYAGSSVGDFKMPRDTASLNFRGVFGGEYYEYQDREIQGMYYFRLGQEAEVSLAAAARYGKDVAWIANNSGLEFLRKREPRRAKEYFTLVLNSYPDYASSLYNLALCEKQLSDSARALELFNRYLKYAPSDAQALKEIAEIYWKNGEREKAAVSFNRLSSAQRREAALAYSYSGADSYRNGRYREAMSEWEKSVILAPEIEQNYFNLAASSIELGDRPGAVKYLKLFIKLSKDDKLTAKAKALINQYE
ncbi:MAG: hypothetical protein A2204_06685 [Elusimicrobia bacterium RIFOXYA1_FULL_47_7]|nr:MAG: hypothetical protein A2278_07875 [Elusimicrobia bacterium RIFOXYA12_FULL_49_49]OGS09521.1 MAG: hypothetical protein A2204_06685 [Elusimicrobia bacterium RIFOXYA1_FULL_47_7]OGS16017.1 MAG: hypothetical protein A2251_02390 [Elusimicrobia bacterium RIFOXYA2_FULL_47_53]OGS26303.1 MAG: hypothetical protein A2339_02875 [Elusimicrobia bacterium RIFOXYB12_FULL_50_12]OGS29185.1 MAG: hypothetical protein A2323_04930 [Elusimicrobia bacterium RIFOXYB2_FULL_46_23]